MFEDHAFLREVNKGPCRFLRGNVFVEMVFVEDQVNSWAKEEIDGFFPTYKSAVKGLCKQAQAAGVRLSFTTVINRHRYNGKLEPNRFYADTLPGLKLDYYRSLGYQNAQQYTEGRKKKFHADEVAMFFVLERSFRAYACNGEDVEFCVITNENDEHAIAHEMLHLFGAADLYYPYHVYGLTMSYFPKSIMCTCEGMEVDPLTRYLVGWESKLSPKAEEFLYKLRDHTSRRQLKANHLEVFRDREMELMAEAKPFASVGDLIRAAENSDPWAEFLLGICYMEGIGTVKNPKRAEELFRLSGRTGLVIGAVLHAQMMLARGVPTPEEREELRMILYYNSFYHLKLITLRLLTAYTGVGADQNKKWAADQAVQHYRGEGLHLNMAQRSERLYAVAEKYSQKIPELWRVVARMHTRYERMLKDRDPDLDYLIARLMDEGVYVKKDPKGALTLYEKAAEEAHPAACAGAARCYRLGIGTVKNPAKAAAYENQERLFSRATPHDPYYKWLKV